MINKQQDIHHAVGIIQDGATIMVGGFGVPGTPFCLIDELLRQGQQNLTLIKNDANEDGIGIGKLLATGQVNKLITTHIGLNPLAIRMMNEGSLEVEFCPQGILAERIRAAGAGLGGFLTDIAMGTNLATDKKRIIFQDKEYQIEAPLKADFALLHGAKSDTFGNTCYAATARNFNPLMAMAASHVILEAEEVVATGEIDPNQVHTPGPFINTIIELTELTEEYGVIRR